MMQKIKILSIIPARGGSKSVPKKNIVNVAGKPLIAWTIKASLASKFISKTVVSSENDEILEISKKCGANVVIRPEKYAKDNSIMASVVRDCITQLINKGEKYDVLILLQPTSPLRDTKDIDDAIKLFMKKKASALISGYEPEKSPYKSFRVTKKGWMKGLVNNKTPFMNRQQLPHTFYPNGAIYIIYVNEFLKNNIFFTSKTVPFYMPIERSIDIDTIEDVKNISLILNDKTAKHR